MASSDFIRDLRRIKYEKLCPVSPLCRTAGVSVAAFNKACLQGVATKTTQSRLEPFV